MNLNDLMAPTVVKKEDQATMAIRLPKDLLAKFNATCKAGNVSAAEVIRRFVTEVVNAAPTKEKK